MSYIVDIERTLESGFSTYRYLENGNIRILEQGREMEDDLEGVRFFIEDVMEYMDIPYGYARTLMYRLFNWPQDIDLWKTEIIIGKKSDIYKKLQGYKKVKGFVDIDEDLTKEELLDYIKRSSKHTINLSTWIKD